MCHCIKRGYYCLTAFRRKEGLNEIRSPLCESRLHFICYNEVYFHACLTIVRLCCRYARGRLGSHNGRICAQQWGNMCPTMDSSQEIVDVDVSNWKNSSSSLNRSRSIIVVSWANIFSSWAGGGLERFPEKIDANWPNFIYSEFMNMSNSMILFDRIISNLQTWRNKRGGSNLKIDPNNGTMPPTIGRDSHCNNRLYYIL